MDDGYQRLYDRAGSVAPTRGSSSHQARAPCRRVGPDGPCVTLTGVVVEVGVNGSTFAGSGSTTCDGSEDARLRLVELVCDLQSAADLPRIDPDTELLASGYIDSLGIVSLMISIEEEFRIDITQCDFAIADFATVNKILELIGRSTSTLEIQS
jgi:acyl carrier protein